MYNKIFKKWKPIIITIKQERGEYPQVNPPCLHCNCTTAIKYGQAPCPKLDGEFAK